MGCYVKTVFGQDGNSTPGTSIRLIPTHTVQHAKHLVAEKKRAARNASAAE